MASREEPMEDDDAMKVIENELRANGELGLIDLEWVLEKDPPFEMASRGEFTEDNAPDLVALMKWMEDDSIHSDQIIENDPFGNTEPISTPESPSKKDLLLKTLKRIEESLPTLLDSMQREYPNAPEKLADVFKFVNGYLQGPTLVAKEKQKIFGVNVSKMNVANINGEADNFEKIALNLFDDVNMEFTAAVVEEYMTGT